MIFSDFPRISVPNYKIGIEIALYCKNISKDIYVQNRVLRYQKDRFLYSLEEDLSPLPCSIDFSLLNVENPNIRVVTAIKEIQDVALNYNYIVVDEDLHSLFMAFDSVKCGRYSESKEGRRWFKIHSGRQGLASINTLKSLEALKEEKLYKDVFFEFVKIDYNSLDLEEVYYDFFKEKPLFVPKTLDASYFDLFYVDIGKSQKRIVDKALIKFIDEPVLYVGKEQVEWASEQVLFRPSFNGYKAFASVTYELRAVGYNQQRQALKGDGSKLYATQKGLFSNEYNFYGAYRRYLKDLIYKICVQQMSVDFENDFKIGNDFVRLLFKTKKIIANFESFLSQKMSKNEQKTIKKDVFFNQIRWDFYSLDSMICIDIASSASQEKELLFKGRFAVCDYYIVSENGFVLVEKDAEFKILPNPDGLLEEDLFSWEDPMFDVKSC